MVNLLDKNWTSGSGHGVAFEKVISHLSPEISRGNNIFIGSDSFISQKKISFVTVVCFLHKSKGGKYFFYKEKVPTKKYPDLLTRISEETRRSIELAEFIKTNINCNPKSIELHLDISPTGTNHATSRFSDMLKGYVAGCGYPCKIKPNAWASQSVADRHSK